MSNTDILTLLAAFAALAVSLFVAGWTVYRDVIQKPKFVVSVAVKSILQQGRPKIGPDFYVEALNLGPLPNRIGIVFARPSWLNRRFRRKMSAFIMSDPAHPADTAKGQKVAVGDAVTFVFSIKADFLNEGEFVQIGVSDGYGRVHWCSNKDFRKAREQVRKALAPAPSTSGYSSSSSGLQS